MDIFSKIRNIVKIQWPLKLGKNWRDKPDYQEVEIEYERMMNNLAVQITGENEIKRFKWGKEVGYYLLKKDKNDYWWPGYKYDYERNYRADWYAHVSESITEERYFIEVILPGRLERIGGAILRRGLGTIEEVEEWIAYCIAIGEQINFEGFIDSIRMK